MGGKGEGGKVLVKSLQGEEGTRERERERERDTYTGYNFLSSFILIRQQIYVSKQVKFFITIVSRLT